MRRIDSVRHARPSLTFGLATGLLTTVHHLHAALVLRSDGPGLHVVWNEAVLLPATLASMWLFLRDGNRWALGVYLGIAMLGFLGLGLYEGGWNHTAKLVAHLRLDAPCADVGRILPADDPHAWFHELTGIATFALSMTASAFTLRFALALRRR